MEMHVVALKPMVKIHDLVMVDKKVLGAGTCGN
jgi:hypothetical protein